MKNAMNLSSHFFFNFNLKLILSANTRLYSCSPTNARMIKYILYSVRDTNEKKCYPSMNNFFKQSN